MLKELPKMLLYMGYLQQPRKTHVLTSHLELFIMTVLFLGNHFILRNRAQEGDPSYYYNSCAPSTCNGLTLTDPLAVAPFCHPSHIEIICQSNKNNESKQTLLFIDTKTRKAFRVLPTKNFTAALADPAVTTVSIFKAYNRLFSCGPISEPNYTAPTYHKDVSLPSDYVVGTHLNCTIPIPRLQRVACLGCPGQDPTNFCYYTQGFVSYSNCESFHMYTRRSFNVSAEKNLRAYLQRGYEALYTKPEQCRGCHATGGRCGINSSSSSWSASSSTEDSFVCFCPFTVHRLNCSDGMIVDISSASRASSGPPKTLLVAVATASASVVFVALLITLLIFQRKHRMELKEEAITKISPSRYSYSQIKKFTNNLSTKLGEGAYGSVYKGVIHQNGVDVAIAVKLLKSRQSGKQFINEIVTTGAVHHQHLVRLLGYCAQGKRHALVYEFMERGSLDKYIYTCSRKGEEEEEKTNFESLSYKQTYDIALQTAKGILYLHQGCRPRILHFDIKPHNVLLDSNFTAKVADFGLAKMMGEDRSHVSLTRARGTPGYVAPEMWLKTYGPVTEKSDVYSYGMMLLEMAGRRKNCDPEANESSSSQAYFPMWAYNRIKIGELPLLPMRIVGDEDIAIEETDDQGNEIVRGGGEEEEVIIWRMCLVGLWCIQHIPSNRPSMDRVIQMLEGNVQDGIPPHPFPQLTAEDEEKYTSNSSVPLSHGSVSWSLQPR